MTKHTPGPWRVVQAAALPSGKLRNEFSIVGISGTIAMTPHPRNDDNEANARLIAAAPSLLDTLQMLADASNDSPVLMADVVGKIARAAIAKATGSAE
jgi:hypothetical protein